MIDRATTDISAGDNTAHAGDFLTDASLFEKKKKKKIPAHVFFRINQKWYQRLILISELLRIPCMYVLYIDTYCIPPTASNLWGGVLRGSVFLSKTAAIEGTLRFLTQAKKRLWRLSCRPLGVGRKKYNPGPDY